MKRDIKQFPHPTLFVDGTQKLLFLSDEVALWCHKIPSVRLRRGRTMADLAGGAMCGTNTDPPHCEVTIRLRAFKDREEMYRIGMYADPDAHAYLPTATGNEYMLYPCMACGVCGTHTYVQGRGLFLFTPELYRGHLTYWAPDGTLAKG